MWRKYIESRVWRKVKVLYKEKKKLLRICDGGEKKIYKRRTEKQANRDRQEKKSSGWFGKEKIPRQDTNDIISWSLSSKRLSFMSHVCLPLMSYPLHLNNNDKRAGPENCGIE